MQLGLLMATPGTAQAFYTEELLTFVSLLVMSGGINLMRRGPRETRENCPQKFNWARRVSLNVRSAVSYDRA